MRVLSAALQTHLAGGNFLNGDLYEITVRGTTYYLTNREIDISWDNGTGSHTYVSTGAMLLRERIRWGSDGTLDDLSVTVLHGGTAQLGGVTWQQRALNGDLKGAAFVLRLAYFSSSTVVVDAPVMFSGNIAPAEGRALDMRLTVRSLGAKLSTEIPRHTFESNCTWGLYDAGCGLTRPTTWDAVSVAAGTTTTLVKMASVTQAASFFRFGIVEFLTGALAGHSRTIVDSVQNGAAHDLTVSPPLMVAPSAGDTIRVTPGCDKTVTDCHDRFNNTNAFMGFPMVPQSSVKR